MPCSASDRSRGASRAACAGFVSVSGKRDSMGEPRFGPPVPATVTLIFFGPGRRVTRPGSRRADRRRRPDMDFMEIPPRKRRPTLPRHAMIVSAALLTLVAFRLADDEVNGRAEVSDAYGFTALFVPAAYLIGWLPEIWGRCRRTTIEPLVM